MIQYMKKYQCILLFHLCWLIWCSASISKNKEKFSFEKLNGNRLSFQDIGLGEEAIVYDDRFTIDNKDSTPIAPKLLPVKLSNQYDIQHFCYNYISESIKNDYEFIEIFGYKISIDSLLKNNINGRELPDKNHLFFVGGAVEFEYNGRDFILLGARDRIGFRNIENNYWFLIEFKNNKVINKFSFIDGYCDGTDCFGDFNRDGCLDYLNWDYSKNKIEMYSLIDNKFVKDKRHFIKVYPSQDNIELMKERDLYLLYDNYDRFHSKWF